MRSCTETGPFEGDAVATPVRVRWWMCRCCIGDIPKLTTDGGSSPMLLGVGCGISGSIAAPGSIGGRPPGTAPARIGTSREPVRLELPTAGLGAGFMAVLLPGYSNCRLGDGSEGVPLVGMGPVPPPGVALLLRRSKADTRARTCCARSSFASRPVWGRARWCGEEGTPTVAAPEPGPIHGGPARGEGPGRGGWQLVGVACRCCCVGMFRADSGCAAGDGCGCAMGAVVVSVWMVAIGDAATPDMAAIAVMVAMSGARGVDDDDSICAAPSGAPCGGGGVREPSGSVVGCEKSRRDRPMECIRPGPALPHSRGFESLLTLTAVFSSLRLTWLSSSCRRLASCSRTRRSASHS
mmetsp:Transcript_56908/g.160620  ORF Transcript_56908/g.160620 Transcript_56908/m.160620 type:complete len:352 (-) Transcript_56908:526-1581(-)